MDDEEEKVVEIMARVLFGPSQRKSWEHGKARQTLAYAGSVGAARTIIAALRTAGYSITRSEP